MRWQALVCLGLLLASAALCRAEESVEVDDDEDFDEERAVLLVRRAVGDKRPLAGKQTTVTISLYNAGNAAATGVKLADAAWPEGFAVEGELAASFESIPAGSSVQHTYRVAAQEALSVQLPGTAVTYTPGEEEEQQTATGPALFFKAHTVGEDLTLKALELGSQLTGGTLNSVADWKWAGLVVGVVAVAFLSYRSYGSVAESNRNRKRAKALAELAAMEKDQ